MTARILGIGFLMSFITLFLIVISPILVVLSLFTYTASIILRAIGWRRLRDVTNENYFSSVGIAVAILGFVFIILLFSGSEIEKILNISGSGVIMALLAWLTYSFAEWIAYIKLFKKGAKIFAASSISVVGMFAVAYITLTLQNVGMGDILVVFLFFRTALLVLLFSSLTAFIGFFRLTEYDLTAHDNEAITYNNII